MHCTVNYVTSQTWNRVRDGQKDSYAVSQICCTSWCDADSPVWSQLCASFSCLQQCLSEYGHGCLHFLWRGISCLCMFPLWPVKIFYMLSMLCVPLKRASISMNNTYLPRNRQKKKLHVWPSLWAGACLGNTNRVVKAHDKWAWSYSVNFIPTWNCGKICQ